MTDLAESYRAMREDVGAVWLKRDVVRATGDEVVSFLQGQLSQDVTRIEVGASAWSWILQPHGKVDALVRLTRTDEDVFLIDVDRRYGSLVVQRLERFKLRTKVEFETLLWKVLALRGPRCDEISAEGLTVDADWNGVRGLDLLGEDPTLPDGVPLCESEAFEAIRIESGFPEMGAELDEMTIPAEAGINELTISFTKGCYTGQELVARIDSRGGNVPRHLRGLVIESPEPPLSGARIISNASAPSSVKPFGQITSSAFSPRFQRPVAIAFIRRDVIVPASALVVTDEGRFPARIEKLPLV